MKAESFKKSPSTKSQPDVGETVLSILEMAIVHPKDDGEQAKAVKLKAVVKNALKQIESAPVAA